MIVFAARPNSFEKKMKTDYTLADVDTRTDCVDIYIEYFGRLTNASSPQTLLPLVTRYLERIEVTVRNWMPRNFSLGRASWDPHDAAIVKCTRTGSNAGVP